MPEFGFDAHQRGNTSARLVALSTAVITAFALSTSALAQRPTLLQPDPSPPKRVVMPGPVEVPLADPGIPNTTLPVVEVMINGRGPYRFAVETGAGFIAAGPGFGAKAGLVSIAGSGGLPSYHIDSITFAGISFQDFQVLEMPRGATGVDGVLGLPFFQDVLLTIDYPARKLRISRDELPSANGETILDLKHSGPFWTMPIEFAGKKMRGVLDTRGTGSLSVVPEIAATLPFEGPLQVIGRAGGAGIPDAEIKGGKLNGDVRLGRYSFTRPTITSRSLPPGFPPEPIVGDVILRNFVVSLDQKNARLRLERAGSTTIELPTPQPRRMGSTSGQAQPATAADKASPLAVYAGEYGDRVISLTDGKLFIQRPGGPQLEMRQTGPDAFTLVQIPEAKFEFTRDAAGSVDSIRVFRNGVWEVSKRSR
jgi:Aspartyl protease